MSEQTVLKSLRGVEFFHDIADEHLQRLAEISRPVEFPANTDIFHEHELANEVYAIISGTVSLVICAPKAGCRQLMEVSDGDLIGWSPLVERQRLSDTARAITRTQAIAIDGNRVLKLCKDYPDFGFEFMWRAAKVMAQRLSATRLQLLELSGMRLPKVVLESD